MTAFAQPSPGGPDLVWVPRADAVYKLAQADSLGQYKLMVAQYRYDASTLERRIDTLSAAIAQLKKKDDNNQANRADLELQKKKLMEQKKILIDNATALNKVIRKLRRGKRWTALGGLAGIGLAFWLGSSIK